MPLPNFFIIGTARSGTTSVYNWLRDHPDVFMPDQKETHFFAGLKPTFADPFDNEFNEMIVTDAAQYEALFRPGAHHRLRGEASPYYLYFGDASAPAIHDAVPEGKLIVLLREPVDRAFSNFRLLMRDAKETATFEGALALEDQRIASGWSPTYALRSVGCYATQLQSYFDCFPKRQIGVWLYEDLAERPRDVFQQICEFLDIDSTFMPSLAIHNRGWIPRSRVLHRMVLATRVNEPAHRVVDGKPTGSGLGSKLLWLYARRDGPTLEIRSVLNAGFSESNRALAQMLPHLHVERWTERAGRGD